MLSEKLLCQTKSAYVILLSAQLACLLFCHRPNWRACYFATTQIDNDPFFGNALLEKSFSGKSSRSELLPESLFPYRVYITMRNRVL
ncbi:MAG: hypothetical protein DRR16_12295 [Candidatus Parabeggiatoa sp. nov. 3]|nr:MAG: hypothetical protein DRR00_12535 [Gammaproteobacteria bacterium]RKZ65901.1 MAG: hypothetical protein DRQ99_11320 [Gammaproteobacteria bacterium]RKZ85310.1 MAG: hypothetical protein DRR16_12295 [Gammaproteobacteria bacterium]